MKTKKLEVLAKACEKIDKENTTQSGERRVITEKSN